MNILTLINATATLNQFGQTKVSPKLAYKIMKLCKSVASDEEFYNAKRNEIIQRYALRGEDGNLIVNDNGIIRIMPDKISEANEALKELHGVEVEIPSIRFKLSELDELKLSAADMYALDELIEE